MSKKTGSEIQLYGIFGYPLKHTLSPVMQEAAFRKLNIPAFYLPFEIKRNEISKLLRNKRKIILDGFNVTVPYKELMFKQVDKVSPEAKAVGAVNTVKVKNGKLHGFNTDIYGFSRSLKTDGKFNPKGKKAVVLGAGGAAKSVVYSLVKGGASAVSVGDLVAAKAKSLVQRFTKLRKACGLRTFLPEQDNVKNELADTDLFVNATPVGLKKNDPLLVPKSAFPKKKIVVYDLIYNPETTKLLRTARACGHRTVNGLGMLLYQGAEAFRIWTGKEAPARVMKEALKKGLTEC